MTVLDQDTADIRRQTEERLVERYGTTGRGQREDDVRAAVADAFGRLSGARVTAFVPVLVERSVRRTLALG